MGRSKPEFRKDRALRFYYDVLGLDRLHYGMWVDNDPRTLDGVKVAQKRYEDFLVTEIQSLAKDPAKTRVLDVGCGSGVMSETLFGKGFDVEGLSPDLFQQEIFEKRLPGRFHLARFQYFNSSKEYDLVLMSESAQYIPVKQLFAKAYECLKPGGHLVVCDYFKNDYASGLIGKSGHKLSTFLKLAKDDGFLVTKEKDVTHETSPTLDAAKIFIEKYILTSIEIFSDKLRERRPRLFKIIMWLFRKRIAKGYRILELLDSEAFAKNKKYMFFIFQKN